MKIILIYILSMQMLLVSCSLYALECRDVLDANASAVNANGSAFSPAKFVLGRRRMALLGRRYDSNPPAMGSSRANTDSSNFSSSSFRLTQSRFELDRILDLLDPVPTIHSTGATKRRFSIKSQVMGETTYIYHSDIRDFEITMSTLKYLAEILSDLRADPSLGHVSNEYLDNFLRGWFLATINSYKNTSFREITRYGFDAVLGQYFRDQIAIVDPKSDEISSLHSLMNSVHIIRYKTSPKIRLEKAIQTATIMLGQDLIDQLYNQFVKRFLLHIDHPEMQSFNHHTEDRDVSIEIAIEPKKLRKTLELLVDNISIYSYNSLVKGAGSPIPKSSILLPDVKNFIQKLRDYQIQVDQGLRPEKDDLLMISIALHHIGYEIDREAYLGLFKEIVRLRAIPQNPRYSQFMKNLLVHFENKDSEIRIRLSDLLSFKTTKGYDE